MPTKYTETLCPQVIYVFRILDADHKDCLKIGMTKLSGSGFNLNNLPENCDTLNARAKARIDSYTSTAATRYELLHTECSLFWGKHGLGAFDDHTVHEILTRSGVQKKAFAYNTSAKEWFVTDLETVKRAIAAAKEGRSSISPDEISKGKSAIIFRPEQEEAIQKAVDNFCIPGSRMLWNCKMRFGKTLSALEVVKRMRFHRTLIVTHRPVVDAGWYDDFDNIFYNEPSYKYGSNERGETFENLKDGEENFIYFASLQFLRQDGDTSTKQLRDSILSLKWDMLIVDEAHEGTLTMLGQTVLKRLCKKKTCVLNLSGTPFNIVSEYEPEEIFNWTYVDEQRAKEQWNEQHPCDHNPYGGLPCMRMAIYDLNEVFDKYESHDGDVQFNFREFFRTWRGSLKEDHRQMPEDTEIGDFVHVNDVNKFLDLLVKPDPNTNYPFSTPEYREIFRHTFWVLPGVAAAKALKALLEAHPIFSNFDIVNVAGEGDDEEARQAALTKVSEAIGNNPEKTRTITLTCANGRLTTGVTVKPWTAVFMLYGATKTKAQGYMQTIFRVQTPAVIGGKRKEECYVFDFAPDRVVTAIDETIRANRYAQSGKPGTQKDIVTDAERQDFKDFIHYCSVIAYDGSTMREYDVTQLLEHLKRVQIERVVRNGFEDDALYNNDLLMNLDNKAMTELEGIKGIIGSSSPQPKMGDFVVNDHGMELAEEETKYKTKGKVSPEEKQARKEKAAKRKQKKDAISILRGISIRIPMLIYGADVKDNDTDITLENFTSFIDKESWAEFMPNGISMQKFYSLRKYYDPDVFVACGKRIRAKAAAADKLPPLQRIHKIEDILSTFKNPDKETVITPWRVVNMHLSETIGGYDFYDETHQLLQDEPRFVDRGGITYCTIEKEEPNILEINSKSGRYPLYMAYSLYRQRFKQWEAAGLVANFAHASLEEHLAVWDDVVKNNIYVLCKTPMAARITKRTLVGFRDVRVNANFYENLIQVIKEKPNLFVSKISNRRFWSKDKNEKMKFNAVIGNPPYQIMDGGAGVSARPVYNLFIDIAKQINPDYISMITPSRWFAGGKGLDDFRTSMLNDRRIAAMTDFVNAKDCFPTSSIGGGVNYFVWDKNYNGDCAFTGVQGNERNTEMRVLNEFPIFVRYNRAVDIIHKLTNEHTISDLISSRNPYGLSSNTRGESSEYEGSYKLISSEGVSYISQDSLEENPLINCYKVLASKVTAEHAGEPDKQGMFKVLSRTEIIEPGTICTDSYLIIGGFEEQSEAEALYSYLCTRFVRFLLLQAVTSINLSKDKFQFIPLQDFTSNSDIDWQQSIFDIERQLYRKYRLSDSEISFIENLIRPMP